MLTTTLRPWCKSAAAIATGIAAPMLWPAPVRAHWGAPLVPDELWSAWNIDPVVILNLGIVGTLYLRGLAARRMPASPRRIRPFVGGLAAVAVALISPLDAMSDQLASAHMIQHMVLMLVAAPLLDASAPEREILASLPAWWRKRLGRLFTPDAWTRNVVVVWSVHAVALWTWHVPAAYQAALTSSWVHDLEHLTFFLTAYLFWSLVLHPSSRLRVSGVAAVLMLFTTTLHASALGALMALAPRPWYSAYDGRTEAWGLTSLEDQQLAGLIMWMPGCTVYVAAAAACLFLSLRADSVARTVES